ncbi:hypothetical protein FBU30_007138 [Linnemannia zychae]|nr:hypothetical protein FBU30_007138 [Linnemannia zychae]
MLARKTLTLNILRQTMRSQQQQVRNLTASAVRLQEQQPQETSNAGSEKVVANNENVASVKAPYETARYRLEKAKLQGGRRPRNNDTNDINGAPFRERRFKSNRPPRNNRDRGEASPASNFQPQPNIPYDTTKELQFADKVDWEVSSVFDSRPLYSNIAVGRGSVQTLGVAPHDPSNIVDVVLPATAYSAHITGIRTNGNLDPEAEQSLIQTIAPIANDSSKDHRKKSDIGATEHQEFLYRMTQNFQETMNPKNPINKFNNAGIKHVAEIKYDIGSDEAPVVDGAVEKSWKRLERLGGDYSRPSAPLSLLSKSKTAPGKVGQQVLNQVSQLIGQNQSIGLEDKKKLLKAVQSGLGSI